ncbi:MAG TPA: hypothetical protein VG756_05195 [Pseudonocardiaceae bacterium]|nr:hypothetical protein [Pseudonocardiaceae bacterium]
MRDIRANAEVTELIAAENLHRLRHDPAYGPFICWHCHAPGDANTETATVIAELGPGDQYTEANTVIPAPFEDAARIALAHADCSRSQVVTAVPGPPAGAGRIAAGSGEVWTCHPLTADLPDPAGRLPLLILDQRPEMVVRGGPDERVTRFYSVLLSLGLTRVTTIGKQLAEAVDGKVELASPEPWSLPPVPGWRLELSARRAARLTTPDGSLVWDGLCGQARPWRNLIARTGRCAVLIGAVGLYPTEDRPFRWITTLLDQAAQAGELAGGLVEAC